MKDYNKKNSKLVRIDNEIYKKAFDMSIDLSKIEGKKISIKEVLSRPIRDYRVIDKLLQGSTERRLGLKR